MDNKLRRRINDAIYFQDYNDLKDLFDNEHITVADVEEVVGDDLVYIVCNLSNINDRKINILKMLLEKGADPKKGKDPYAFTRFYDDKTKEVLNTYYKEKNNGKQFVSSEDINKFVDACGEDDLGTVKDYVENKGIDVNVKNVVNNSGLNKAILKNALKVANYLIDKNATMDDEKVRSSYIILSDEAKEIVDNYYFSRRDKETQTKLSDQKVEELFSHVEYAEDKVKQTILFDRVDIDIRNNDLSKNTLLLDAYFKANKDLVMWLLKNGANPREKNAFGYSVENIINFCPDEKLKIGIKDFLLEHEFPEPKNDFVVTADELDKIYQEKLNSIADAIYRNNLKQIEMNVVVGEVDVNVPFNYLGRETTLLEIACNCGNYEIVNWLLENGASPFVVVDGNKKLYDRRRFFNDDIRAALENCNKNISNAPYEIEDSQAEGEVKQIELMADEKDSEIQAEEISEPANINANPNAIAKSEGKVQTKDQVEDEPIEVIIEPPKSYEDEEIKSSRPKSKHKDELLDIITDALEVDNLDNEIDFSEMLSLTANTVLGENVSINYDGETTKYLDILEKDTGDYMYLSALHHEYTAGKGKKSLKNHNLTFKDLDLYNDSRSALAHSMREMDMVNGSDYSGAQNYLKILSINARKQFQEMGLMQLPYYLSIAKDIGNEVRARENKTGRYEDQPGEE